jgi:MSHA pilin protein MshD
MPIYAAGVTHEFATLQPCWRRPRPVRPRWGLENPQGLLRDAGLWSGTPSAYLRPARLHSKSGIRNPQSRGLTLVEVVAATLIVGIMTVAALNSLGAATKSSISISQRALAVGLADELMAEIQLKAYEDPNSTPAFGLETGETAGLRSTYDDVDDYEGYNQSPPKYSDGTTMPDRTNWRHKVDVSYTQPADPAVATAGDADQGVKYIKVTVEYNGQVLAEQYAVRGDNDN